MDKDKTQILKQINIKSLDKGSNLDGITDIKAPCLFLIENENR